ncbi:hypothetical protein F5X99DRAFT_53959 [Biscogniauxia marginata]|nr:hypothetical protein F5X99DRAFT_53959 [Biscogniauxia marginata]
MTTPVDRFLAARHKGFSAPLDVALAIIEYLETPEDVVNYALSHRDLLDYWINYSSAIQERWAAAADPESNPLAFEPDPTPANPQSSLALNSERDTTFRAFSMRIVQKLFSPTARKCLTTAIMMPNPSDRIYDIEYRRANPSIGLPSPFPDLFARKSDRFQMYWNADQHQETLFSFKNLNRISPIDTASRRMALDFSKKALSLDPSTAHHSPPSFAHPSLRLSNPLFRFAESVRNDSPIQDLAQLHETERERLLSSFYMYETLCATSLKITGNWEIRHGLDADRAFRQQQAESQALTQAQQVAINAGQAPPDALPPGTVPPVPPTSIAQWNQLRCQNSPLWNQPGCQVERVRTVYMYVKLQWHLMFHALFVEWLDSLTRYTNAYNDPAINNVTFFASQDHTFSLFKTSLAPPIFQNRAALLEQIDVLCSKGLAFLHEALCMSADDRRQMLVSTFYPRRWSAGLSTQDYLVKGLFHQITHHKTTLMHNNSDLSWTDSIDRALGHNYAWLWLNTQYTPGGLVNVDDFDYGSDRVNPLRRRGYVFWNQWRLIRTWCGTHDEMEAIALNPSEWPLDFCDGSGFLDDASRGNQADLEFTVRPRAYPEMVWQQAAAAFRTPYPPPALVEFPIMGETIRIWEDLDANGNPIYPTF